MHLKPCGQATHVGTNSNYIQIQTKVAGSLSESSSPSSLLELNTSPLSSLVWNRDNAQAQHPAQTHSNVGGEPPSAETWPLRYCGQRRYEHVHHRVLLLLLLLLGPGSSSK